jgi:Ni/Co efflux regulator RcnB
MNRQILISLLAAALVAGTPLVASADDDRDRKGSWKVEKNELRHYEHGRDRHKGKHKHKPSHDYGKEKHRHPGERYPFTGLDRFKYDDDHEIYHPRDRHHRHGGSYWYYDDWDRDDYRGKKHRGYRARVISVVPITKVIRSGRHCRSDYGSGDWLELSLGDVMISLGNNRDDCYYLDREIRSHYRVTYIYKGRINTVRMHHHPGKYIRVNRGGNPLRGRH